MKILNEQGVEITNPDLSLGRLVQDVIVEHHPAVEGITEVGHYEVLVTYPNGGQDLQWVVDTPGVEAQPAHDDEVTILRYVLFTSEELNSIKAQAEAPTQLDKIEAQVTYTAMMTNTLLEGNA